MCPCSAASAMPPSINDYTLIIKSRSRVLGSTTDFSARVPNLHPGLYKCTLLHLLSQNTGFHELQARWNGLSSVLSNDFTAAFTTICVFDEFLSKGVFYLQNPGEQLDLRIIDIATDEQPIAFDEHIFSILCERIQ
jgi:hypothetical protein